jgi:hypothetical protein
MSSVRLRLFSASAEISDRLRPSISIPNSALIASISPLTLGALEGAEAPAPKIRTVFSCWIWSTSYLMVIGINGSQWPLMGCYCPFCIETINAVEMIALDRLSERRRLAGMSLAANRHLFLLTLLT